MLCTHRRSGSAHTDIQSQHIQIFRLSTHTNRQLDRCTISIFTGPFACGPSPNFAIHLISPHLSFLTDFKMDSTPSSNPPAGNLQPNLHAALIVTLILAVTAVILRFLARRLVKASIWLDDWLTLVALVRYSSVQEFPSSVITSFPVYGNRF